MAHLCDVRNVLLFRAPYHYIVHGEVPLLRLFDESYLQPANTARSQCAGAVPELFLHPTSDAVASS